MLPWKWKIHKPLLLRSTYILSLKELVLNTSQTEASLALQSIAHNANCSDYYSCLFIRRKKWLGSWDRVRQAKHTFCKVNCFVMDCLLISLNFLSKLKSTMPMWFSGMILIPILSWNWMKSYGRCTHKHEHPLTSVVWRDLKVLF